MDVANTVRAQANLLPSRALALIGLDRERTGLRSEKPAHDLGHATIRFSLALTDLATAGEAADREMEARFEPDQPPSDGLAQERAQLALLSAIAAGDFALDAFAWAELVRRDRLPERRGDKVPALWPKLMAELDALPSDPMTAPARYLDVTLDAARDALGAHRDPELEQMIATGTGGLFGLTLLPPLDDARIADALRCLDRIAVSVATYFVETSPRSVYRDKVTALIHASPILDGPARHNLRAAYRLAGISSPSLAAIASRYCELVDLHLGHRGVTVQ